jgi:5,10-methylenetetrahydrofolate reductase
MCRVRRASRQRSRLSKVRAGTDAAITHFYFYNPDSYFRFLDDVRKLGLEVSVMPGIMPIISATQLMRFFFGCLRRGDSALDPAAPAKLRRRQRLDQSLRTGRGDPVVRTVARGGGVPGLHFYTHLRREIGDIACPGMHPVPETKSPFDGVFCSSAKAAGLTKLVPTMPRRP